MRVKVTDGYQVKALELSDEIVRYIASMEVLTGRRFANIVEDALVAHRTIAQAQMRGEHCEIRGADGKYRATFRLTSVEPLK